MKVLLEGLLPRLFPDLAFLCVEHDGRKDLERSVPRKLRAWREPGVRFIVLRDNDGADCRELKQRLLALCRSSRRVLVRLACQELEAWYLGEPDALAEAFRREDLRTIARRARLRNPDAVSRPSLAVRRLVPSFQKVSGARRMARHLTSERNRSASFQALLRGIEIMRDIPAASG